MIVKIVEKTCSCCDAVFVFISVGRDGIDGRDGVPGINGIPGKQGSPGKLASFASKGGAPFLT